MERKANQRSTIQRNTDVIRQRRLRLAGHCIIHLEELVHNMVLRTPKMEHENEADDRELTQATKLRYNWFRLILRVSKTVVIGIFRNY